MDKLMALAKKYNLLIIEDAAQGIDAYYKGRPLGSIGHLAAFSFHETKNITSGEGGLLAINDEQYIHRSEIIWEKGTNRAEFYRGKINKYGWVDTGSSFLPAEIVAAFLWAQLENIDTIQAKRKKIWEHYYSMLKPESEKAGIMIADLPGYATNNAHMFYMVCESLEQRTALMKYLKQNGVETVFHYLSLHKSPYYQGKHDGRELPQADRYTDCLVRLPMYYELTVEDVGFICEKIKEALETIASK
jgi:dTDP-4-amino-4,6-dideoxygalactose transaminase